MNTSEQKPTAEAKAAEKKPSLFARLAKSKLAKQILAVAIIILAIIGGIMWKTTNSRIYTDQADIEAPITILSPSTPGILNKILVHVGDRVEANTFVAQVGDELVQTKVAGIITSTEDSIGKIVNPGEKVVSIIEPSQLRVVAHVDEDKGLADIHVGDHAVFTVDAFGSTKYEGVVDEVSPTARSGDIVFNISDKRQVQTFDVKIRFSTTKYAEISNGMSAKVWMYTK